MTTSAEQIRSFKGAAFLSFGFRPFFLFGAVWAAAAMGLWLSMLWRLAGLKGVSPSLEGQFEEAREQAVRSLETAEARPPCPVIS